MIDHVTLHVSDYLKSKDFYAAALGPLGYAPTVEMEKWKLVGFGIDGKSDLWLVGDAAGVLAGHIAYAVESKEMVQKFYDAALAAGGTDNGAPGYRKEYTPGYYAAFVTDPDGHNIEALFIDPNPEVV